MIDNLGEIISNGALRNVGFSPNNLNIIHINSQSLCPRTSSTKLDEIRNVFDGEIFDVIAVSESWLKPFILNNAVSIDGYYMHRNDRIVRNGGGVCLYIKNGIKSKVIHSVNDEVNYEALFVEILGTGSVSILLGVIYLPGGNCRLLEEDLGDLVSGYEHVVCVGDFNNNLFNNGDRMREMCSSLDLNVVHNSIPTHFDIRYNRCSLIDYFLVALDDLVCCKGQFQFPALNSYHSAVYISYEIGLTRVANLINIRDYSRFSIERCERDIAQIDFGPIYDTSNANFQVDYFTQQLLDLYDRHVPTKTIKIRRKQDWMKSRDVLAARENRDFSYRAYLELKTQERWRTFCRYRNKLKSTIRKSRSKCYQHLFSQCNTRQMWNELRGIGVCSVGDNGNDYNIDVDQCNNFFILPEIPNAPSILYSSATDYRNSGFSFRNASEIEVWNAVWRIKSNCIGPDGLSIKFLKLIFSMISTPFTYIINSIITTSIYPLSWKCARVVPVPKVKNPKVLSDFRPINVLSVCSKILEIILNDQLTEHLTNCRLLSDNQSGFRKGHNTTTLVLSIIDDVRSAIDQGKLASVISLDFSRAFESISHEILLNKLFTLYNFSTSACRLIDTFMRGRSQYVQVRNEISRTGVVHRGVPQGSILGPQLFLLYINDVLNQLSPLKGYLYADDLQLVAIANTANEIESTANNIMRYIESWCVDNFIALNVSKSKAMFFGSNRQVVPRILVNGEDINFVSYFKVLGIYIDYELSFFNHINFIISRIIFTLKTIHSSCYRLPLIIRKRIAHALLMPFILYGLEVFSGTIANHFDMLKKACFNRIIRYVYHLKPRDHVSSYAYDFLGCSFDDFVKVKLLTLFYKTVKYGSPTYLSNRFVFANSARTCGLTYPRHTTTLMERSFLIRVMRLWNNVIPYTHRNFSHSVKNFSNLVLGLI